MWDRIKRNMYLIWDVTKENIKKYRKMTMIINWMGRCYHYYAPCWVKKIYRRRAHKNAYHIFMKNNSDWMNTKELQYVLHNKLVSALPYEWTQTYSTK